MLFNSAHFLIFFPLVAATYFAFPYRFRWILLLGASYYFYMCWRPEYIILIILSTLGAYFTGLQIGKTEIKTKRRKYLIICLLINLGILFLFKYFNFLNNSLRGTLNNLGISYGFSDLKVLLPIGISFYTFQNLSYAIDVYRGDMKPEKNLGIFALYVVFFPQLVAGPIERSTNLLHQFYKKFDFSYERVTYGLRLMAWGFFQKVVIADRLAVAVDKVYNNPSAWPGISLIIATYFFAFQIYCDFSGYTDIARGAAKVMGFELMLNFRQPYFATSIRDFWHRWHISLTSWFRDYLYIPLGGKRVSELHWYWIVVVVFLVSGLWHGANWTFVVWGALHAFYFLFSHWMKKIRFGISSLFNFERFPLFQNYLRIFITFHLVLFAWIFFRANSINDAFYIITHLFSGAGVSGPEVNIGAIKSALLLGMLKWNYLIAILSIVFVLLVNSIEVNADIAQLLSKKPVIFRYAIYLFVTLSIMNLGVDSEIPFIYFQF